jgi:repressor LexA
MNKKLPNYTYALISSTKEATDGNMHAVCVNGHEATIERVQVFNNGFELQPDSDDPTFVKAVYDLNDERTETVNIIGRVV